MNTSATLAAVALGILAVAPSVHGQDCDIAQITTRTERLDGHPQLTEHPNVYTGGFKLALAMRQRPGSDSATNIEELRVRVLRFTPGPDHDLAYGIGYVYAKGQAKPQRFSVTLFGNDVQKAHWIDDKAVVDPNSDNLLNTSDARYQPFTLSTETERRFEGTVLARKAGLYDVDFRVGYRVAGGGRMDCSAATVKMYQHDDY